METEMNEYSTVYLLGVFNRSMMPER